MNEIFTIQIQIENCEQYNSYIRNLVSEVIHVELQKKKHNLGEVRVNVWKQDALDKAIWNLAEKIKEAASYAVSERIH